MLNLVIAFVALIIWSSVVIYYFRTPLFRWLDNRFGKDPALPDVVDDDIPAEPETPPAQAEAAPPPADKAP